jgi:hypothetical protein
MITGLVKKDSIGSKRHVVARPARGAGSAVPPRDGVSVSERSEVGDASGPRLVRSALYLDFDNVYSGLCRVDRGAATAFANNPGLLLDWLGSGEDDAGAFRRCCGK